MFRFNKYFLLFLTIPIFVSAQINISDIPSDSLQKTNEEISLVELYSTLMTDENEVKNKRDLYSQHFQIDDTTNIVIINSSPIHYKDEFYNYVSINNNIIPVNDNVSQEWVYQNESNDIKFYFNENATKCLIKNDLDGTELVELFFSDYKEGGQVEIIGNTIKYTTTSEIYEWKINGSAIIQNTYSLVNSNQQTTPKFTLKSNWLTQYSDITPLAKVSSDTNNIIETTKIYNLQNDNYIQIIEPIQDYTNVSMAADSLIATNVISVTNSDNLNSSTSGYVYKHNPSYSASGIPSNYLYIQNTSSSGCSTGRRGYVRYNISSIPDGSNVTDVDQYVYVFALEELWNDYLNYDVRRITHDVSSSSTTYEQIWDDIQYGTLYENDEWVSNPPAWEWSDIPAENDIENALSSNWFMLGYMVECNENNPDFYAKFYGTYDPPNLPYMAIVYTPPTDPYISGYITQSSGSAISGVTVTFNNGGGSDVTDANGYYSEQVPYGWTGTATPNLSGWSFSPLNRSYSNVTNNDINENYTGTPPANPDIDVSPNSITINEPSNNNSSVITENSDLEYKINLKNRQFVPPANVVNEAISSIKEEGGNHIIIQFTELPTVDKLNLVNINTINYIPNNAILATVDSNFNWNNLPNVRWIGKLLPSDKISVSAMTIIEDSSPITLLTFIVEAFSDVDGNMLKTIINGLGGDVDTHPDFPAHMYLVTGTIEVFLSLSNNSNISWISVSSTHILHKQPSNYCPGPSTIYGPIPNFVANGNGWDGPGLGSIALTYHFVNGTPDIAGDLEQNEMVRSTNIWSQYAQIFWAETPNRFQNRSVDFRFATGDHCSSDPFDGPGGTLAHCFYPSPPINETRAGDCHFDEDETWNIGSQYDLFSVSLHELGHGLGLMHTDVPNSVMLPVYAGVVTDLGEDDIAGIRSLYASNENILITNTGNAILNILSIADNKSWLSTSDYPNTPFSIVSDNSQNVNVNIDWSQFGDTQQTGTITITSNDPDEQSVTVSVTAIPEPPSDPVISGSITQSTGSAISGVTVTFNNGGGSDVTDANGYYSEQVPYGWTGTATPSLSGWSFSPENIPYNSSVTNDKTNENYTGTPSSNPVISGYITQSNGSAISGVTVTFTNSGGTNITDANGYYSKEVPYGWTGTATPSLSGWSFSPENIPYNSSVTSDKINENYTGTYLNPCISGSIIYNTESGKFNFCEGGIWVEKNGSTTLFSEQFSTDVFGNGDWARSDGSISVNTTDGWLHIGAGGGYDGFAEKIVNLSSPITVESRMKLVSGGNNYRLPALKLYYGPTDDDVVDIFYLRNDNSQYGWRFKGWTFLETHSPTGENIWVTVKAIIRADGGELLAKFDSDNAFTSIITKSWSIPNTIVKIRYGQPWDAVCEIDYISVY